MKQATVTTAFPRAKSVARTLGVSHDRATKIVSLMDRIAATGRTYQFTTVTKKRKARVAKKK